MTTRILLLIISATLAGCSQPNPTPTPAPRALVSLDTATRGAVTETLTVYGDVSADLSAQRNIVAPVEAIVTQVLAPLGSNVSPDDVIARLSPSPSTSLSTAQAAASADQADEALARAQRLRSDGLVGNAEVETARAAADSADAALASLRGRNLELTSPVAGTVTNIGFAEGDLVVAGATVAVVTTDGDVRAQFGIDPTLARLVSSGDAIAIAPPTGGPALTTTVVAVDPVVDPVTRLASIFAIIPASAEIAPGEPLQGQVTVARTDDAVTVAYEAILDDGGQSYVYRVQNGIARRRDIATGGRSGDRIAVVAGISAGDLVVTAGAAGVSDGLAVRTSAVEGHEVPADPVQPEAPAP